MIVDARKSSTLKSTVDTLLLCLLDVTVQRDQDAKLGLSWLRCAGWNFKVIHLQMSLVMIVMSLWPLVDAVYVFAVCFSCVFFFFSGCFINGCSKVESPKITSIQESR